MRNGGCVVLSWLFNFARLGGRRQSPETWPKGACGHRDGQSPHRVVAVPRLGWALGSGETWGAQHPWRCSLILVLSHTTIWKLSEPLPRRGAQEVPVACRGTTRREQGSSAPGQGLLSLVLRMDWMGVRESSRNHPVPWHTPGLLCLQPLLHLHCGAGLSLRGETAGRARDPPVNSEHP